MIRLKTTARCLRTPDVLMALEELGLPYELERVSDGYFSTTFGRPGPQLFDGELSVFEPAAIIRHLARQHAPFAEAEACRADQWMDFAISALRPSIARIGAQRMSASGGRPETIAEELGRLTTALALLDCAVRDREYLLGRFTVVDCAFSLLAMLPMLGLDLSPHPALAAYRARLVERPSWSRVMNRVQA